MTDRVPLSVDVAALDEDVAALLPRLESNDPATRRIAVLTIADLEAPSSIELLCAVLLNDVHASVRAEAARVLASWETNEAVDALAHALLDVDQDVREAAAQALAQCKDARLAPSIATWLDRPEAFVRASIFRALRELRDPLVFDAALRALGDAHVDVRTEAVTVLGWLRDARAVDALARALDSDDQARVRHAASAALGMASIDDDHAVGALLRALSDAEWLVRESAAATLGRIASRDGASASVEGHGARSAALETGASTHRRQSNAEPKAANRDRSTNRATVVDALIRALDDAYWQVRVQAARALGRLRDPAASDALVRSLGHTISNLRKDAALALGDIADSGALPALERACDDPDPEVRKAVRIAIGQIRVSTGKLN